MVRLGGWLEGGGETGNGTTSGEMRHHAAHHSRPPTTGAGVKDRR